MNIIISYAIVLGLFFTLTDLTDSWIVKPWHIAGLTVGLLTMTIMVFFGTFQL